jgi:hypothetical protein
MSLEVTTVGMGEGILKAIGNSTTTGDVPLLPSLKASGDKCNGVKMPKETHTRAAEHHENAAKAHRTAAEHHGKGDHDKGHEESTKAHEHPPKLIVTQPRLTGRAANTGPRNNP